jgi:hypothetical protein
MSTNTNKRGCFYFICKCFKRSKQTPQAEVVHNNTNIPSNPVEVDDIDIRLDKVEHNFKVDSKISKVKLQSNNDYEDTTPFNCPICFKFYNNILQFNCCKNYICLYCSEDYKTTHVKYEINIKCPFCQFDGQINVTDVETIKPEKMYIDNEKEYITRAQ